MDRSKLTATGGAGLLLAAGLAFPALAQVQCSDPAASDSCSALMAHSLAQNFIQGRLDRGNAAGPGARIDSRLNGKAWNPHANGAAPITLSPGEGATDFATSLSQWGSWEVKTDANAIDEAKPLLEAGARAPSSAQLGGRQVDVWTQTRVSPLKNAAGKTDGEAYTSNVGADYKLRPGLLVGGLVQLDKAKQSGAVPGGSASGQGFMAGPYMAMKLSPNVTVDANAAWGQADDSVTVGAASSEFETTRRQAKAQGRLELEQLASDYACGNRVHRRNRECFRRPERRESRFGPRQHRSENFAQDGAGQGRHARTVRANEQ